MTEAQLQAAVIDLAHLLGWKVAHFRPARTARGWRTPVSADGAGFPDLVLAKPGQPVIFAEVKPERGHLRPDQTDWLRTLDESAGCKAVLWRPADWHTGTIEQALRPHPRTTP
jgi:hypothetical protein